MLGIIRARQGLAKQIQFVPNTFGASRSSHIPMKILQLFPSFKLGNSISVLKLAQNCLIDVKIYFS